LLATRSHCCRVTFARSPFLYIAGEIVLVKESVPRARGSNITRLTGEFEGGVFGAWRHRCVTPREYVVIFPFCRTAILTKCWQPSPVPFAELICFGPRDAVDREIVVAHRPSGWHIAPAIAQIGFEHCRVVLPCVIPIGRLHRGIFPTIEKRLEPP